MPSSPGRYGTRLMFAWTSRPSSNRGRAYARRCGRRGADISVQYRSAGCQIEVATDLEDRVRAVERVEVQAGRAGGEEVGAQRRRHIDADLADLGRIVGGVEPLG